ncbi:hypothetical protein AKJ09_07421 [Labilithrix luteola]|uniref:Uncharacterized protein n=1 Tax=Labilithrix luteola TaxID=1391654 RepID=A0A0K1Q4V6_9BACT|nr:hypothetical protein [Labilithrix luteola]AKV00758.1 hypothetical protein AKJ09_07421 [Labilithrix luteola]
MGAKTSNDILCERNELAERVRELESLLATIQRELDVALEVPEVSFLAVARIATLVRPTIPPAESTTRPITPLAPLAPLAKASPAPAASNDDAPSTVAAKPQLDSEPTLRSAVG